MSAEKIINIDGNNFSPLEKPNFKDEKIKNRVNINELLARVREEKKKEGKVNIIFFGLLASLVFIAGIILSF